jgi:hypothetical protein
MLHRTVFRPLVMFVLLASAKSLAAQVVVTELTYTHSGTTTRDSHMTLTPLPGTPSNWVSPVDYSQGTAVVRLEVFTKPTDAATRFQICFEGTPSYACTDQAPAYMTTGVYTWTSRFTNFYQFNQVNWAQGVRRISLILKNTTNGKPSPENVGVAESARYMPTDLRVTVTLVSAGATYQPPSTDAGAVRADAGVLVDAGMLADAGALADAGVTVFDGGVLPLDAGTLAQLDAGGEVLVPGVDAGAGCMSAPLGFVSILLAVLGLRRRSR